MQASKQILDRFFDKQKEKIASVQIDIAKTAFDSLFAKSPHKGEPGSNFAEGEYDANHKISINGKSTSSHHSPTGSRTLSAQMIAIEKNKAEQIDCGDTAKIFNTSDHDQDVEYGGKTWGRPGYKPYRHTKNNLRARYNNVLE